MTYEWSVSYDDSALASRRWVVYRDGKRWCDFGTQKEADDYVAEQRRR